MPHTFRVWAPSATTVELELPGHVEEVSRPMERAAGGWWERRVEDAGHGTDYAFRVDGGDPTPDPRSAWQPFGVHGPSRVHEASAFRWTDDGWAGRDARGAVFYELHVGTFTREGTLDAAVERLQYLVDLGVEVVELLPVAAFEGPRGWGYDGVHLYAVHDAYGGPEALQRFVDAAHALGLGVCLDVVYNHLGPSGNYLSRFGPYFTDAHETPWGQAVNLDQHGSDAVRRWVCDNALRWFRDFHVDCLRLDAVHALVDDSPRHLLAQLADETAALAQRVGRPLSLVAESDLNDAVMVTPTADGGFGMTAQWDDDVHHAVHAAVTGDREGYYSDFGSLEVLATVLEEAFWHAGRHSSFRGRVWGTRVDRSAVSGHRFVAYTQDHDQVGNRATGDRPSATQPPARLASSAALVLTSPFTPMLFMGEEWGASTPWQFFTSFEDAALAESVRQGRRREFAEHGWAAEDVPDPQDAATRDRSVLDWSELEREPHAAMLRWYRDLLELRAAEPDLADPRLDAVRTRCSEEEGWLVVERGAFRVAVNLADGERRVPLSGARDDASGAGAAGVEGALVLAFDTAGTRVEGGDVVLPAGAPAVVRVT